jgi:hypothetical protein
MHLYNIIWINCRDLNLIIWPKVSMLIPTLTQSQLENASDFNNPLLITGLIEFQKFNS